MQRVTKKIYDLLKALNIRPDVRNLRLYDMLSDIVLDINSLETTIMISDNRSRRK